MIANKKYKDIWSNTFHRHSKYIIIEQLNCNLINGTKKFLLLISCLVLNTKHNVSEGLYFFQKGFSIRSLSYHKRMRQQPRYAWLLSRNKYSCVNILIRNNYWLRWLSPDHILLSLSLIFSDSILGGNFILIRRSVITITLSIAFLFIFTIS